MLGRMRLIELSVWVALLASCGETLPEGSVRAELVRLQEDDGLTLTQVYDNEIITVQFRSRSRKKMAFISKGSAPHGTTSSDGVSVAFDFCPEPGFVHPTPYSTECPAGATYLGVIQTNGREVREYRHLAQPFGPCWSYDKTKLALTASIREKDAFANEGLQVLSLGSGDVREVDGRSTFVTSQCWSPDGRYLVYTVNKDGGIQLVRMYDTETNESREIAKGGLPTWSSDGEWISFQECPPPTLRDCTYFVMKPSTGEKKALFKVGAQGSPLWWSPDSQFVAYVNSRPPAASSRLWVRRLSDGAEDWVLEMTERGPSTFQWIQGQNRAR